VKTYRRHGCERRHRTYLTLAKCIWRRAGWIAGEGPFAVLAWCRVLTVTLHATHDGALESKRIIDLSACGGRCTGRHEIIRLQVEDEAGAGDHPGNHRALTVPEIAETFNATQVDNAGDWKAAREEW
jgi:hypothetical protein